MYKQRGSPLNIPNGLITMSTKKTIGLTRLRQANMIAHTMCGGGGAETCMEFCSQVK